MFIAAAKVFFIVASYAVYIALPRLLGSPKAFGLYSTAMSLASMVNNVLIVTTVQTVSKWISERPEQASGTLRQSLKLQLGLGTAMAALLWVGSRPLAESALRDAALTPLLRIACLVVLAYALYAPLVGSLNGRRRFRPQAGLDATFSTLRTLGILGGAILGGAHGKGAIGAMMGFAAAAIMVVAVGAGTVGVGRAPAADEDLSTRRFFGFMGPLALFHACLNGVLLLDIPLLKGNVAAVALAQGEAAPHAAAIASEYAGYYSAAQKFALVPYQLMMSMTWVVFPTISRVTSAGDHDAARQTIRGALRLTLLVLVSVAAPIAGAADGVMLLAYEDSYLAGAGALRVLVLGAAAFSLFVVTATALTGSGRPGIAAAIAAVGVAVVIVANRSLIGWVGVSPDIPVAAASATTLGMSCALFAAAAVLHRVFGVFIRPLVMSRVALAGVGAFLVASWLPHANPAWILTSLACGFLAYGAALILMRELTGEDLRMIQQTFSTRRAPTRS